MREIFAASIVQSFWSINYDNYRWSSRVVTTTVKLHVMVSSIPLLNSEIVDTLIKKLSLVSGKIEERSLG